MAHYRFVGKTVGKPPPFASTEGTKDHGHYAFPLSASEQPSRKIPPSLRQKGKRFTNSI